jgi:hypothetical protein
MQVSHVLESKVEELFLPSKWDVLGKMDEFSKFSKGKVLFSYQVYALENALKALYIFFGEKNGNKSEFVKLYQNKGILSLEIKEKLLSLAEKFFNVENRKISFDQISNRMSFWMATGSGKLW